MSGYAASERITVAATPQACFDTLTDLERLADWQRALKRVEVIERHNGGAIVEYVLDAKLREVKYRLALKYDAPHLVAATYISGDFRDLSAEWRFKDIGDALTEVELALHLDPGLRLPGPIRSMLQDVVMTRAMRDLKTRVEGG